MCEKLHVERSFLIVIRVFFMLEADNIDKLQIIRHFKLLKIYTPNAPKLL